VKGLVVALSIAVAARVAVAGDPTRVYKTVETEHFIIHYWEPLDDVATRVGVCAERAHRLLAPALDHEPDTKTIINIADDTDSANGFAGVLPRNAIQLYATGPTGFSELDDHDDWLYGLVAHEYTHILHLDTMEGLPKIYNAIFGKTWAPSQVMPRWVIEGIAVYEESKRSAGGRNRGTRFDQYIRIARHADMDMRLDQVSGAPRDFPHGNAAYVYGSHFLRYVFDRFGDDTLRQMSHTAGAYAPPYAINRQIAKVVGKPFTELYDDWKDYLRDRYSMQEQAAERRGLRPGRPLTRTAEGNAFEKYSHDGKQLVWVQYDGYSLPTVRVMPVGGDQRAARDVVQIDDIGPLDVFPDGSLVYEQTRQYRRDYTFQDLMRWDAPTRQYTRLTIGRRARDPAISPDGRRVAYSQNERSESVLAVMDMVPNAPSSVAWRGERYDQAYQPVWSPDGKRIAFSAWRKSGLRDILIVELASGAVEEVTHDRAIDMAPAWSRDGKTLYFDSDRTGISNIYAYDLATRKLWQVSNVLGGAFGAAISPDGTRLAYQAAIPNGGYDLYEIAIDRTTWQPARDFIDDKPPPIVIRDDEAPVTAPRRYRALESLAPLAWTGQLVTGTPNTASIQTNGSDALGLHGYSLAVGLDLDHGDTNVGAAYGYSGWRPSVRIAGSRTLVERGGFKIDGVGKTFHEEDWSGTLSLSVPFEARPGQNWSLSFDYDLDWFRFVDGPMVPLDPNQRLPVKPITDYAQAGLSSRVGFSNIHTTVFGLGPVSGFDASVSLRIDHPELGATYRGFTLNYATDVIQRLWGETPVIAARLVGGFRAGDLVRAGGFSLGGIPAQDIASSIVSSIRTGSTGYLRGYPARTLLGNQFHLLNVEYRQELWRVEHGLQTLPIYLRRLHLGLLSDTGIAFDNFDASKSIKTSLGAALRLDAFFGYYVPGTFELGVARGLQDKGTTDTWFLLTGSI
jgi:Tol biopolymer transport system component